LYRSWQAPARGKRQRKPKAAPVCFFPKNHYVENYGTYSKTPPCPRAFMRIPRGGTSGETPGFAATAAGLVDKNPFPKLLNLFQGSFIISI
jgi:hypothetical protein